MQCRDWIPDTTPWRRRYPCESGCPQGKYSVGDVFFAELTVYRYICRNADELFRVGVGEVLSCEVDAHAFHNFVSRMVAS